jgi:hypothetical protein
MGGAEDLNLHSQSLQPNAQVHDHGLWHAGLVDSSSCTCRRASGLLHKHLISFSNTQTGSAQHCWQIPATYYEAWCQCAHGGAPEDKARSCP